jgi:hypothetical protein
MKKRHPQIPPNLGMAGKIINHPFPPLFFKRGMGRDFKAYFLGKVESAAQNT